MVAFPSQCLVTCPWQNYSLVRLVRPKMEELISQLFLGLSKIRLLSHDRTTSQNVRNWVAVPNRSLFVQFQHNKPFPTQHDGFKTRKCEQFCCEKYKLSKKTNPNVQIQWETACCVGIKLKKKVDQLGTATKFLTFCEVVRSWDSNRIFDRPRNGREISSSIFGLTRRTRLQVLLFQLLQYFLSVQFLSVPYHPMGGTHVPTCPMMIL